MFLEALWTTTAISSSVTLEINPPVSSKSQFRPNGSGKTCTFPFGCGAEGDTMQTKRRFDPNSPEIKAYRNELAHQFVREGTMVALPTCLIRITTPIAPD